MFNNYDEHWKFWYQPGVTFEAALYVHPGKQNDVQKIYDCLYCQEDIQLLVIFGSAVTLGCHAWSDIDIYIETRSGKIQYELPYDQIHNVVDVVCNITDWNYGVAKEIAKKGIVLFDRR